MIYTIYKGNESIDIEYNDGIVTYQDYDPINQVDIKCGESITIKVEWDGNKRVFFGSVGDLIGGLSYDAKDANGNNYRCNVVSYDGTYIELLLVSVDKSDLFTALSMFNPFTNLNKVYKTDFSLGYNDVRNRTNVDMTGWIGVSYQDKAIIGLNGSTQYNLNILTNDDFCDSQCFKPRNEAVINADFTPKAVIQFRSHPQNAEYANCLKDLVCYGDLKLNGIDRTKLIDVGSSGSLGYSYGIVDGFWYPCNDYKWVSPETKLRILYDGTYQPTDYNVQIATGQISGTPIKLLWKPKYCHINTILWAMCDTLKRDYDINLRYDTLEYETRPYQYELKGGVTNPANVQIPKIFSGVNLTIPINFAETTSINEYVYGGIDNKYGAIATNEAFVKVEQDATGNILNISIIGRYRIKTRDGSTINRAYTAFTDMYLYNSNYLNLLYYNNKDTEVQITGTATNYYTLSDGSIVTDGGAYDVLHIASDGVITFPLATYPLSNPVLRSGNIYVDFSISIVPRGDLQYLPERFNSSTYTVFMADGNRKAPLGSTLLPYSELWERSLNISNGFHIVKHEKSDGNFLAFKNNLVRFSDLAMYDYKASDLLRDIIQLFNLRLVGSGKDYYLIESHRYHNNEVLNINTYVENASAFKSQIDNIGYMKFIDNVDDNTTALKCTYFSNWNENEAKVYEPRIIKVPKMTLKSSSQTRNRKYKGDFVDVMPLLDCGDKDGWIDPKSVFMFRHIYWWSGYNMPDVSGSLDSYNRYGYILNGTIMNQDPDADKKAMDTFIYSGIISSISAGMLHVFNLPLADCDFGYTKSNWVSDLLLQNRLPNYKALMDLWNYEKGREGNLGQLGTYIYKDIVEQMNTVTIEVNVNGMIIDRDILFKKIEYNNNYYRCYKIDYKESSNTAKLYLYMI